MNEPTLAETITQLERERDAEKAEANKWCERACQSQKEIIDLKAQLAALEAENQRMLGYVQRFQPAGSPPPLAGAELAFWICRQMHERIEALEADKRRLDWIEKRASQSFAEENGEDVEYVSVLESFRGNDLRAAIDLAMKDAS